MDEKKKNTCIRVYADQVQIDRCKKKVGELDREIEHYADILKLIGNAVRMKILYLLAEENELCVCDLSDILGMQIPAISQHLRKLKDKSIVQTKKVGQTIYYSITLHNIALVKHLQTSTLKEQETL